MSVSEQKYIVLYESKATNRRQEIGFLKKNNQYFSFNFLQRKAIQGLSALTLRHATSYLP
jgi:hypothetical protein